MKRGSISLALLGLPLLGSAQAFSDNFDAGTSGANWTVNNGGTALYTSNFAFDYSTIGIAAAPHSTGGTTIGLQLQANLFGGPTQTTLPGMSVSPTGKSFSGDYTLQFDAWQNINGPLPAGGAGSTQMLLGGVMSSTAIQTPGYAMDGVGFAATGDGGSGSDYRAYAAAGALLAPSGSAATYAAGTTTANLNNSDTYYKDLQGHMPAAQTALAPTTQTGNPAVGALGMAWYTWKIQKSGSIVTWRVDGNGVSNKLIATVDTSLLTARGGGDIFLGVSDINNGAGDALFNQFNMQIVDNVTVTTTPEPGTWAALGLGAVAMLRRRRAH